MEEELAGSSQPPDSMHELQAIRQERKNRLEEIENLQRALRTEVEQLRIRATEDQDSERRIERIEGETIPDLETKRRAVQAQLQELNDMIRNAKKWNELSGRINKLKEQKQSFQKNINRLKRQI